MTTARFETLLVVTSAEQLRALFGNPAIALAEGASVTLEGEISIDSGVELAGRCELRDGTRVGSGSILTNVVLGRANTVRPYSILSDVNAGDRNLFGPFCFIRDNCTVGDDCILGAHVEAARSSFESGIKVSHRAFIGDAAIGEGTIIGAGVVFCNFDGARRQPIRIASFVTVGSGSMLVAPITIGERAVIGAGSTVTKDVRSGDRIIQRRSASAAGKHDSADTE